MDSVVAEDDRRQPPASHEVVTGRRASWHFGDERSRGTVGARRRDLTPGIDFQSNFERIHGRSEGRRRRGWIAGVLPDRRRLAQELRDAEPPSLVPPRGRHWKSGRLVRVRWRHATAQNFWAPNFAAPVARIPIDVWRQKPTLGCICIAKRSLASQARICAGGAKISAPPRWLIAIQFVPWKALKNSAADASAGRTAAFCALDIFGVKETDLPMHNARVSGSVRSHGGKLPSTRVGGVSERFCDPTITNATVSIKLGADLHFHSQSIGESQAPARW